MFSDPNDTIAAIATPSGAGGIAIVRVSGADAERVLRAVFRPAGGDAPLPTHLLTYGRLIAEDGAALDEAMAVLMRAPRSYTREDVAELHVHGGAYIARRALALALRAGARLAEPGEFTRRAFLNGRIDLAQADAVMDMIHASGERAARAAARQLAGGESRFVRDAREALTALLAGLAAAVDYPEEIDDAEAVGSLAPGLSALSDRLRDAADERGARIVREGLRVALCGRPNAGKSSLFNALLGEDRAIVTDVAGTTRDVLTGDLAVDGVRLLLMDTAGLRETRDAVERIGVSRAEKTVREADAVLLLIDAGEPLTDSDAALLRSLGAQAFAVVLTKSDRPALLTDADIRALRADARVLHATVAREGGLAEVWAFLRETAALPNETVFVNARHIAAARAAAASLQEARDALSGGMPLEIAGVLMNEAMRALCDITGDDADETLLDDLFSRFCVGK